MKRKWIWRNLVVSVTLSVASLAAGDVVTVWNTVALNAIRASSTTPPQASRALAILHTSIYDAVNGIFRTHEPYFVKQKGPLECVRGGRGHCSRTQSAHNALPDECSHV